jgi:hypothetical protein
VVTPRYESGLININARGCSAGGRRIDLGCANAGSGLSAQQ